MIELLLEAERALEMGRVDAAATMYGQVADADPRNAIAVVGLARVAIEHGDEPGALELARRALVIDPENAAAGRMVTRLEEVIAYRGVAQPSAHVTPTPPPPAPEPASSTEPTSSSEPTPPSEPALAPTPRRRSWLDRLLRRDR